MFRGEATYRASQRHLDVRFLDQALPFLDVALDAVAKLFRRTASGLHAFTCEPLFHCAGRKNCREFLIESSDDVAGNSFRPKDSVPMNDLEARHRFVDGGYVRKRADAAWRRYADRA